MGTKYTVDNSGDLALSGNISIGGQYQVEGVQLSSEDLSDGGALNASSVGGVTLSGTPTSGQVLTATSSTTAD